ncbi:ABC transporter ATP-binding protein [Kocuria massiliensis]|uniref:ABC transporter ATP-binding protein n=1 Tax=Kocuria massiliensis TaxID=1926282 RepID=UPI0011799F42|nr:ATP-binding cassette domain-containing protein [Kocuria massiliensis]
MAQLSVAKARKTYPGAQEPALDDVDLTVEDGESYVILGPSGSGKSTLLRSIAGLENLDSGEVRLDGSPLAESSERLAMVFQDAALYPWLTVSQNIALSGRFSKNRDRLSDTTVDDLLGTLGLRHLKDAYPEQLSGGQAQRVAVGRALALTPDVLLLDEPLSALDPATREDLQGWLRDLMRRLSLTCITVTHDVDEATALADRVGFFDGPGGFSQEWSVNRDQASPEADPGALTASIRGYYRQARGDYSI